MKIPKKFWWAEGAAALTQDWRIGDFETYIDNGNTRLRAFEVSFAWEDFKPWIPDGPLTEDVSDVSIVSGNPQTAPTAPTPKGGRPTAEFWEDCLIDICFMYFRGELLHKT